MSPDGCFDLRGGRGEFKWQLPDAEQDTDDSPGWGWKWQPLTQRLHLEPGTAWLRDRPRADIRPKR
jgi:hypothetical protein